MRLMPVLFIAKVGGVDPKQLAVYEEFARNVPGFLPTNDLTQPTGFLAQPMKVEVSELISLRVLQPFLVNVVELVSFAKRLVRIRHLYCLGIVVER